MDGYYDQHPLVFLERHLALAGLVTEDTRRIGHQVACLTGLPYFDLERLMEHEAGMSIWEMISTEGLLYYRDLERRVLARALADRPHGVLVLGDGTLLHEANRRAVHTETTLVALERDLSNCYWRFLSQQTREPGMPFWHPLFPDPLTSIRQVRPFYQERQPTLQGAAHTIAFAGYTVGDVVRRLLDLLDAKI